MPTSFGDSSETFCYSTPQFGVVFCDGVKVYIKIFVTRTVEISVVDSDDVCDIPNLCQDYTCVQTFTSTMREEGMPILKPLYDSPLSVPTGQAAFECQCLIKTRKTCTLSISSLEEIDSCPESCSQAGISSYKCGEWFVANRDTALNPSDFKRYSISCISTEALGTKSEDCTLTEEAVTGGVMRYPKKRKVTIEYTSSEKTSC